MPSSFSWLDYSEQHRRQMAALRRALAVYRMVFGQSRQEDLVSYLLTHVPEKEIAGIVEQLRIDLTPPKSSAGAPTGRS